MLFFSLLCLIGWIRICEWIVLNKAFISLIQFCFLQIILIVNGLVIWLCYYYENAGQIFFLILKESNILLRPLLRASLMHDLTWTLSRRSEQSTAIAIITWYLFPSCWIWLLDLCKILHVADVKPYSVFSFFIVPLYTFWNPDRPQPHIYLKMEKYLSFSLCFVIQEWPYRSSWHWAFDDGSSREDWERH
jgi:hypothetical protein